ncbi:xylulokinase [Chromohalobacter canadensis]|uniref:xylulokinase n=1 Tax=Chromohalobacter canadensis TaxID=141389 RepID=UPI0021BEB34F|nr:xylulokinase [Chromohalobacter canadensis]MCT8467151.1 xylulokinase [Chromohalobacter canadensis]MCT8471101.1 xylulokinase [Chromohalobacter canadensis]MCT8497648.1 xylulokinase [Chromohalobacter canadensis]
MYVGVDCGTQSTKVVVVDIERAAILGEASRPHHLIEGDNGKREQDVSEWVAALTEAFHEAVSEARIDARDIRAIGVSGQQHGMVALDADGQPLHPAKLWCDTETALHNETLIERLGGREGCLDKLGLVLQTGYTASKVTWLRDTHPDAYRRIATLLLPHDYLNFWLTGERVAECGDASGTGYFDTRTRSWRHDVFQAMAPELSPEAVLPRLIDSHAPVGTVRPEIARLLGIGDDVLVSSGGGDNMMAAIGTGNIAPGMVTLSLGTSGTVYAHSAAPMEAEDAQVANFCASHGGWLPLICTMNVTSATTKVRELFGLDLATFGERVARAPLGAEGVMALPFFNGERVPALPHATASFEGMTSLNTTADNLCRAVVEGTTFGLRYGFERLGELASQASQVRLVGGGAKSAVWRQIVADVLDVDVICPRITEAAALGGAIQAAWCDTLARGRGESLAALTERLVEVDLDTLTRPRGEPVRRYQELYQRYRQALAERYDVAP